MKTKFIEYINESKNIMTLYHGANEKITKFKDQEYIFLSTDMGFSERFGVYIYSVKADLGKIFDSRNIKDIQKLYKAGFKITDPYLDPDWDDIDYDWDNEEYPSAKAFVDSPYSFSDSWNGIESTEGVREWIFDNGYNSILITEENVINYLIKNDSIIEVKPLYKNNKDNDEV